MQKVLPVRQNFASQATIYGFDSSNAAGSARFADSCLLYTSDVYKRQMQDNVWYYMLCKDENFTERIIDRYFELRESYLSDDYINEYMDAVIEYLGPAVERNFEVWGYTWNKYMICLLYTSRCV